MCSSPEHLPVLAGSCHLLPHAASLLRLLFLAVWSFAATALPEAPSGAHECAREWAVGAQAGGCLSTPPSAQLSLGGCHSVPGGPGWSHFLNVLITSHTAQLCQADPHLVQVPGLPYPWKQLGEEVSGPAGPSFLPWVSPAWCLFGVQTCGCALEKTLSLLR